MMDIFISVYKMGYQFCVRLPLNYGKWCQSELQSFNWNLSSHKEVLKLKRDALINLYNYWNNLMFRYTKSFYDIKLQKSRRYPISRSWTFGNQHRPFLMFKKTKNSYLSPNSPNILSRSYWFVWLKHSTERSVRSTEDVFSTKISTLFKKYEFLFQFSCFHVINS